MGIELNVGDTMAVLLVDGVEEPRMSALRSA